MATPAYTRFSTTSVDANPRFDDPCFKIGENVSHDLIEVHRAKWFGAGCDAGEFQKIIDQALHALGGGIQPGKFVESRFADRRAALILQLF
jgi:hypothetical protein